MRVRVLMAFEVENNLVYEGEKVDLLRTSGIGWVHEDPMTFLSRLTGDERRPLTVTVQPLEEEVTHAEQQGGPTASV